MKLSLRACSMIALVACGCLPASSRTKITEVEFVEEVLARQTALECRYAFECPDLAFDLLLIAGRHETLDACLAEHQLLAVDLAPLRAGVDSDRVTFDESAARDCLEAYDEQLEASTCVDSIDDLRERSRDLPGVCDRVFSGEVSRGDACANGFECEGDDTCVIEDGECGGVCMAAGSSACLDQVCEPGKRCVDDACVFTRLLGQECRSGDDCGLDARCNFSEGKGTCVLRESLALGQACSASSVCGPGLSCDRGSRACIVTPSYEVVGAGESCRTNYITDSYDQYCGPGLACTGLTLNFPQDDVGTCTRPSREGQPCSFTSECSPGLYCTGFASDIGECVRAKTPGGVCAFGGECDSGACDAGLCVGESSCR